MIILSERYIYIDVISIYKTVLITYDDVQRKERQDCQKVCITIS